MHIKTLLPSGVILCVLIATASACGCGAPLPQDPFDPLGPWHQRHLDCGIPPFAYRLPQETQAKIHAIWVKYSAGDDCEEEQRATQAVIDAIPNEMRMRAFRGMCGPGFLVNASATARDAFQMVWFDDALDINAKQAEFARLATQHLSGLQLAKFEKFNANLAEAKKRREEMINGFSPAAREAYDKWNAMHKEERAFLKSLPLDVRVELGLVCHCCNGCTAPNANDAGHAMPNTQQSHRARRHASPILLAGALRRADRALLATAADVECQY